jgi:hypothetical protein
MLKIVAENKVFSQSFISGPHRKCSVHRSSAVLTASSCRKRLPPQSLLVCSVHHSSAVLTASSCRKRLPPQSFLVFRLTKRYRMRFPPQYDTLVRIAVDVFLSSGWRSQVVDVPVVRSRRQLQGHPRDCQGYP